MGCKQLDLLDEGNTGVKSGHSTIYLDLWGEKKLDLLGGEMAVNYFNWPLSQPKKSIDFLGCDSQSIPLS